MTDPKPPLDGKVYRYTGFIEQKVGGGIAHCALYFPYDVPAEFGRKANVRVHCLLNGKFFRRALISDGQGEHFLTMSREIMKQVGVRMGSQVEVELWADPAPDALDEPEELLAALDLEPKAHAAYHKLNIGMRRNICYYINGGKRPETRAKRAAQMLERLLSGNFHIGGQVHKGE